MTILDDGTPLLTDDSPELFPDGIQRTMLPRSEHPRYAGYCSQPGAKAAESVLPVKIPRSDWAAIIEEKWANESWPMCYRDFKCRSQDKTSSCWAQAACSAVDIKRRQQGMPHNETSAISISAYVTGFRDVGGWSQDAVEELVKTGACNSKLWPNSNYSRSYDNAESKADRINRKIIEWADVPANDLGYLFTFLAAGFPCPVGYNRWSHAVCAVAFKLVGTGAANFPYGGNPAVCTVISNSWQNAQWGYSYQGSQWTAPYIGFGNLDESWTPDDCQAVLSVTSFPG